MGFLGWAADTTTGGAGGTILTVTNLNASGAGSLREAAESAFPRIIKFALAGNIDLENSGLTIGNDDITIDGESAPGNGITITRGQITLANNNSIVTHIRSRPGTGGLASAQPDAISTDSATNFIIDHCSVSWSIDELLSISGPKFTGATPADWTNNTSHTGTVSNCLISEPLNNSIHPSGIHGYGTLMFNHVQEILFIGNLWVSCKDRTPLIAGGCHVALINNVMYNSGSAYIRMQAVGLNNWEGVTPVVGKVNAIGNVAIIGPNPNTSPSPLYCSHQADEVGTHYELWFDDNIALGTQFGAGRTIKDLTANLVQSGSIRNDAWHSSIIPIDSSLVFDSVIKNVGALPNRRDRIDQRIIEDVIAGTHSVIDNENDVGGYNEVNVSGRNYLGFTDVEKDAWVSRSKFGPYRDSGTERLNDWFRILNGNTSADSNQKGAIVLKNDFYQGGQWNGSTASTDPALAHRYIAPWLEPFYVGHSVRDAALVYHMYRGDIVPVSAGGGDVAASLFGQAVVNWFGYFLDTSPTGRPLVNYDYEPLFQDTPWFKTAGFSSGKLIRTFDLVKDLIPYSQVATIEDYLYRHADYFKRSIHAKIIEIFPNRLSDDYSTHLGVALAQTKNIAEYTHQDASGVHYNQIYIVGHYFNNRRAEAVLFFGLVGILLNDQTLIDHAKRYVKEWIKFCVFPDGTTSEYERNDPRPIGSGPGFRERNQFQGLSYNAVNLQMIIGLADAFARTGDFELYEYSTSEGYLTTIGGPKSIKLVIDRNVSHMTDNPLWYNGNDYLYNLSSGGSTPVPINDNQKLNFIDLQDSGGRQWIVEMNYMMQANMYYQDSVLTAAYGHTLAGSKAFNGVYGGEGDIGYPWNQRSGHIPGVLLMFAETESLDIFASGGTPPPAPDVIKYLRKIKGKGSHYLNLKPVF